MTRRLMLLGIEASQPPLREPGSSTSAKSDTARVELEGFIREAQKAADGVLTIGLGHLMGGCEKTRLRAAQQVAEALPPDAGADGFAVDWLLTR